MNYTANFEHNVLYNFSGYQTRIFHSKYVIMILLCLVLTNSLFPTILLGGLRANYFIKVEDYFSYVFGCYLCFPLF